MSDIPALPWTIDPGFDLLIASTAEDADGGCSILAANGETVYRAAVDARAMQN